jgi:hypothetical protein
MTMGSHPLCTRIPLREATGERVRALLGSPNRYYAQRPPHNPARWRELLGRSRPGAGFGEAREPHDWEELLVGERARALSVERAPSVGQTAAATRRSAARRTTTCTVATTPATTSAPARSPSKRTTSCSSKAPNATEHMGVRSTKHMIALDERAGGERVRVLLGSPNPYYAQRWPLRDARWRELLGRSRPGAGFGEAREWSDWQQLKPGMRAYALSVEPGAARWFDARAYKRFGGDGHHRLYCHGDSGHDVRSGFVTLTPDGMPKIEGAERD